MDRKQFIRMMGGATGILGLSSFQDLTNTFKEEDEMMPTLFVGHGSPMNAIEDNEFSARWRQMGTEITKPKAVVCVSAHWLTRGSQVTAMNNPRTIHDFGGFPKALFDAQYPAPGSPELATDIVDLMKTTNVHLDHEWGLDHGTWSIVKQMYPDANIPVLQFSIDYTKPAQYHFELAKQLLALRKKGVLIIGSGNMVHNLGILDWRNPNSGFDWAAIASAGKYPDVRSAGVRFYKVWRRVRGRVGYWGQCARSRYRFVCCRKHPRHPPSICPVARWSARSRAGHRSSDSGQNPIRH